ncbi:hypothetical protein F5984_19880 [Rudanella paleaurantiibacter]|uniref:Uncharacterized protein n=1 Tax=Rudanella paleaurantiibacter TaxID=2614655 RepID=A0A7J5TVB2_9BACT|nr:hypothetical protein [Rudanella paleaurantiibacter]KAB7728017.1 hypothetical protein F5984_19880 [Rudanella paleaurantiibacter]
MEASRFNEGMALGQALFVQLDRRGSKYRSRFVPAYIRQHLWLPWYLTRVGDEMQLYIIQPPNEQHAKVHFVRWLPPDS